MSRLSSIALSTGLIGAGGLAWAVAGRPLIANSELNAPLNPLGLKRSPYGEVLAMALQGPIDTIFDAGISSGSASPAAQPAATPPATRPTLNARFSTLLISLDHASAARTNPKAGSEALKRHLRRQVEDKLRFAYQLDPSHYGNYNSLHFFLTEPEIGTRPELTASAAQLAEDTIRYCFTQDQDPRPALTAAAAATNILEWMFNDQHNNPRKYNNAQIRQYLNLLDLCLARYDHIAGQWDHSKQWDLLSPQRIAECEERHQFITKIRDAMEKTLLRIEPHPPAPQAAL